MMERGMENGDRVLRTYVGLLRVLLVAAMLLPFVIAHVILRRAKDRPDDSGPAVPPSEPPTPAPDDPPGPPAE